MPILDETAFASITIALVSGWLLLKATTTTNRKKKLKESVTTGQSSDGGDSNAKAETSFTFTQGLLLVHTVYIAYQLLVSFPINVFTDLKVPLSGSADLLRYRYIRKFAGTGGGGGGAGESPSLSVELEELFRKLGSFDMRIIYVRFGHDIVTGCNYCQSFGDYALLALPQPLLAYVREMAVIGAITIPYTPRAHLRPLGLAILMLAALGEAYWTLTVPIAISSGSAAEPPLITMWHDALLRLRLALFLLLPFSLYLPRIPLIDRIPLVSAFLPIPRPTTAGSGVGGPVPPALALAQLQRTLDHLLPSLHLLRFTRAAVMRIPSFRERAGEWWEAEKREGDVGLANEGVKRTATGLGVGYDDDMEGKGGDGGDSDDGVEREGVEGARELKGQAPLRQVAKSGIDAMLQGVPPSEHWNPRQS